MPNVPRRGETVPDFCLADATGTRRCLSDLASDRPPGLLFYRGWWAPFCPRELADYRDRYHQSRAAGASLAAVSVDTAAQSEALHTQLSLPFPILCDRERHVIREWDL